MKINFWQALNNAQLTHPLTSGIRESMTCISALAASTIVWVRTLLGRCKQKQRGLRGLICCWPSITEWEMHITAQPPPRLRNDLYCVEWDVKLYYTCIHTYVYPTKCYENKIKNIVLALYSFCFVLSLVVGRHRWSLLFSRVCSNCMFVKRWTGSLCSTCCINSCNIYIRSDDIGIVFFILQIFRSSFHCWSRRFCDYCSCVITPPPLG